MGNCATSQAGVKVVSTAAGSESDAVTAALNSAVQHKREAMALARADNATWADQLHGEVGDLEKVVAQRQVALEGGAKHESRKAKVFAAQLAASAEADLLRWKADGKPPPAPFQTPPSAARRRDIEVLTPPEFRLPGWDERGDEPDAAPEQVGSPQLQELVSAREELRSHTAAAAARAAELEALKARAARLRGGVEREARTA